MPKGRAGPERQRRAFATHGNITTKPMVGGGVKQGEYLLVEAGDFSGSDSMRSRDN